MVIQLIGLALTLLGAGMLVALRRSRVDEPEPGWRPDPTVDERRGRFWDDQAWTHRVRAGDEQAVRGRRFRGLFWGPWVWAIVVALVTLGVGAAVYNSTESVAVLMALSLVVMSSLALAFYLFVARQLDLHQAIGLREVVAATVTAAGVTLVVAMTLNDLVIESVGLTGALITVGPVEESTKLIVPLALFALGWYRNPRAGIALGLAGGAGFAIAETVLYGYTVPKGGAPDPCTGETIDAPGVGGSLLAQAFRFVMISPLHWLWTGIAVAVIWRLWHLYGRARLTVPVVATLAAVMATHSLNDTSALITCGGSAGSSAHFGINLLLPIALYLAFRFFARQSTPPQHIGVVSRGWHPTHIAAEPETLAEPATPAGRHEEVDGGLAP
ncbi:PrsW family glutamic-type intramembrane protease [Rhodococcus daqingensis]|uniref:PrsW family glutamic-type intramembrane protease n=1 Tax=Rhodococcus daqingensis TaxID=2479363 RepID=A0ABW2S4G3_9NOCA